ncbi:hypothetical protein CEUSTIGMA_g10772.t1 [Chlamydomonas eustigma]|uniref:Uncharacterized protein n=1 Tax=Chlamydomonas eustigma TaxID=1157962 RepID=A0A250XJV0_9CHLO|nr:hypothetical protein CEUSTIGMA_g10772.t1 [Chlamydomonas eustigma]|eukprot:GAX83347.1 hypothetical protein CEUSTIGMA_g10772.t1 [Chlamydomonas eustigma]
MKTLCTLMHAALLQVVWSLQYPVLSVNQPPPAFTMHRNTVYLLDMFAYASIPGLQSGSSSNELTGVYAVALNLSSGSALWATPFPTATAVVAAPQLVPRSSPISPASTLPHLGLGVQSTTPSQPPLLLCSVIVGTSASQMIIPLDPESGSPLALGGALNLTHATAGTLTITPAGGTSTTPSLPSAIRVRPQVFVTLASSNTGESELFNASRAGNLVGLLLIPAWVSLSSQQPQLLKTSSLWIPNSTSEGTTGSSSGSNPDLIGSNRPNESNVTSPVASRRLLNLPTRYFSHLNNTGQLKASSVAGVPELAPQFGQCLLALKVSALGTVSVAWIYGSTLANITFLHQLGSYILLGTADQDITVLTAAGLPVVQETQGLISFKSINMKEGRDSVYALTRPTRNESDYSTLETTSLGEWMVDSATGQLRPADQVTPYQQFGPDIWKISISGDLSSFAVVHKQPAASATNFTCYFSMLISLPSPFSIVSSSNSSNSSGVNSIPYSTPLPELLMLEGTGQDLRQMYAPSLQELLASALPPASQSLVANFVLNPVMFQTHRTVLLLLESQEVGNSSSFLVIVEPFVPIKTGY